MPLDNCDISQEIKDLYEICMNKNWQTRPKSSELLGLQFIQKWANELNIKSHQFQKCKKTS